MIRNRVYIILLMAFVLMLVTPVIQAQDLNNIDFDAMKERVLPGSGGESPIFGVLLYGIFIISAINMALIPDKQLMASMLNVATMMLTIIFKLLVGSEERYPQAVLRPTDFVAFFLMVGLFIFPFIIAGMVRSHKGKPSKAIMPAAFQGLIGVAFNAMMFFEYIYDSSAL